MGKKIPWESRQRALHLLIDGQSVMAVGAALEVPPTTIYQWARIAGMELRIGPQGGVAVREIEAAPVADPGVAYRRLTLEDRSFIHAARSLAEPLSMRRIAAELGVSPSTVSREIRAHQTRVWKEHHYDARIAHYQAVSARSRVRAR